MSESERDGTECDLDHSDPENWDYGEREITNYGTSLHPRIHEADTFVCIGCGEVCEYD